MNAYPRETSLLTPVIGDEDSDERLNLQNRIAQARRHRRCVQRFASVIALFPLLALAGVGYETMWQTRFPYDGSHPGIRVLCGIGLASLVCLAAFAGLLMGYHKKLKRLRWERPHLATRLLQPYWDKPDIPTVPGSHPEPYAPRASQGAAEGTGYDGGLDSPSWRSSRLCG